MTIINIYTPNKTPPKYMKQKLTVLKGGIKFSTLIAENFNTPISIMDRTNGHINKETESLSNTIHQFDLIAIYRTIH